MMIILRPKRSARYADKIEPEQSATESIIVDADGLDRVASVCEKIRVE